MHHIKAIVAAPLTSLLAMTIVAAAHADTPTFSSGQKPAWLTDASLGIKEAYDDNIFLSGVDAKYLPAKYTVPAGSVAALENEASWVTTVSPKVGVDFAPLLGRQDNLQALWLAYAPDFVTYHDASSESYDAQRVLAAAKAKWGDASVAADNCFTYIDGSDTGPTYPGALYNAYMNAGPRERRRQIQDKANVAIQYNWGKIFVRPTASLAYYDMMTSLHNVTGYQNYSDRGDVNGGADVGYRVFPDLAFTLGYRYGHQYQQQFYFTPYSSPSDYQRVLLGVEGKPWKWLDVKFLGGPDFRAYPGNTATHITPVNDLHPVKYYGEALMTATISPNDAVTFKYKQWQWVSSVGKVPYYESTFDLSYHRKVTEKLGFDLGGRIVSLDYTAGNLATCRRNDYDYLVTTGVGYALNRHVSLNLTYQLELGRNAENNVINEATHEYTRDLVSLGAVVKF